MKLSTAIGSTAEAFVIGIAGLVIGSIIFPSLASIILVSIICTGGIALIIWVPFAFLIGAIVIGISNFFSSKKELPDENALRTYVKQCRSLGFENTTIAANLARAGWSDEKIESAVKSTS